MRAPGGLSEVMALLSTSQKKWSPPGRYLEQNLRWREWLCKGPGVGMCPLCSRHSDSWMERASERVRCIAGKPDHKDTPKGSTLGFIPSRQGGQALKSERVRGRALHPSRLHAEHGRCRVACRKQP